MRWSTTFITAAFLSICLTGCGGGGDSGSTPSETDIASVIKSKMADQSQGDLALKAMKKTDGAATPAFGLYLAYFDAEIEVMNDARWDIGQSSKEHPTKFQTRRDSSAAPVGKGQVIKVHGTQRMHKTENGWGAEGDTAVWPAEPVTSHAAASDAAPAKTASAEPTDALAARGLSSGLSPAETQALMADPKIIASMKKLRGIAAATELLRDQNRERATKKEKVRRMDVANLVESGLVSADESTSPFGGNTPGFAMAWWVRSQGDSPDTIWAYDKGSYSNGPAVVIMFVDGACAVMKKEAFNQIARDFTKQAS